MMRQARCQYRGLARVLLIIAIIVSSFFSITPIEVAAQNNQTLIRFQPNDLLFSETSNSEIAVWIQDVKDLYAFDITLKYDPAYLEILDSDLGINGIQVSQGTFLDAGLTLKNTVDPTAGTINLVLTQLNPSTEKSGDGSLLVIRMKALKAGNTTLQIENLQLSTRKGLSIPFSHTDANLSLSSAPQIGPSPTPFQTNYSRLLTDDSPITPLISTPTASVPKVTESVEVTAQATETTNVDQSLITNEVLTPNSPEVTATWQSRLTLNPWSYLFFSVMLFEGFIIVALFYHLFTRYKN
jgi:hypothetical protein